MLKKQLAIQGFRVAELSDERVNQMRKIAHLQSLLKNLGDENIPPSTSISVEEIVSEPVNALDRVAVLMITYERPKAIQRSLRQVLEKMPSDQNIDIIVSQDVMFLHSCFGAAITHLQHEGVAETIRQFQRSHQIEHIQRTNRSVSHLPNFNRQYSVGYYQLSQHYKFALSHVFDKKKYDYVIIIEEDLDIGVDFFNLMSLGRQLLARDPTLLCVSAWNDNGRPGLVKDNARLYRSDFFPGLGWIMKRSLWEEIGERWPSGFWDDWLREPPQRKNRHCIFPEIPRTNTFGYEDGTSRGQFVDRYIKPMILSKSSEPFMIDDYEYLDPQIYKSRFIDEIRASSFVTLQDSDSATSADSIYIEYHPSERETVLYRFGLMTDEKAGVTRTSYFGIISFWRERQRVHLGPRGARDALLAS